MRKLVTAAAAVMAFGIAAPAFAQSSDPQSEGSQAYATGAARDEAGHPNSLSRSVSYGDLDLRKPQDQAALRQRVSQAAEGVCNALNLPLPNPTNLGQSCQDRAIDGATRQVDAAVTYAMNQPPADSTVADVQTAAANTAATAPEAAPAPAAGPEATVTTETVTNGPAPDTPANRARFGGPMSVAGRATAPTGD